MKAVIESRDGLYLISIYGSDELPCDTYVVERIYFSSDILNDIFNLRGCVDENLRFAMEKV